jgi:hypothetical protein
VLESVQNGEYTRTVQTEKGSKLQVVNKSDMKGCTVLQDNLIKFENVPIITPNGKFWVY